ncbi:glycoside hydrolase family 32 protein [Fontibacter flavus]|uniref:Glycoside hydrolase family 32 protein n=1 Tax=Fontibacter flavus TaxID=654838 RepID=A0ABV6FQR8_9BACT
MKNPVLILSLFLTLFISCQKNNKENSQGDLEFQEPFRPQFHFSPAANWMNDPNGMVYWDGEYHLFYQYYPDSTVWGPMHWGHAVSEDLVHWEHLPIALFPDTNGWIFSGSAVIDHQNTSGLGTTENPAMIAIFTYHDHIGEKAERDDFQTQGIAYSTDRGRTWTMYEGNPVLKNPGIKDFRDPKVFWSDDAQKWIMSLAVKDKISFYSSSNLLDWTFESDFNPEWAAYGGVWECPDLFPLQTKDGQEKWVLFVSINPGGPQGGSATQYFIGDFDGKSFTTSSTEVKWLDWGADNYAGVTWSNVPEKDGRKLFIGWMSNWQYAQVVPTKTWRSAMTVPRQLDLVEVNGELGIASKPIAELEKLRNESIKIKNSQVKLQEELIELELDVDSENFRIEFLNDKDERLILEQRDGFIVLDRGLSGLTDFEASFANTQTAPLNGIKTEKIHLYLDRSSIEIFINDGQLVMTSLIFPTDAYNRIELQGFSSNNRLHYLKSIW